MTRRTRAPDRTLSSSTTDTSCSERKRRTSPSHDFPSATFTCLHARVTHHPATMNDLQTKVRSFVAEHRLGASVEVRLLDVMSELGEVAKEVLRSSEYGKRAFTPSASLHDELGDVLFSLLCIANDAGVDVQHAVEAALTKYERRIRTSGTAGSPDRNAVAQESTAQPDSARKRHAD